MEPIKSLKNSMKSTKNSYSINNSHSLNNSVNKQSRMTKSLCFSHRMTHSMADKTADKKPNNESEDEVEEYLKENDDHLIVKIDDVIVCKSRRKLLENELQEMVIFGGVYYLLEDKSHNKKSLINKSSRNEKIGDKTFSIFDIEYSGIDIKGLPLCEVIPYTIEQYEEILEDEDFEIPEEF
jgi:hypothetical protein